MPLEEARRNPVRLYDPFSYAAVMRERMVEVTCAEAFGLAVHYPLVWRHDEIGRLRLVVLRRLSAAEEDIADVARRGLAGLPLLLRAYPFRQKTPSDPMDEIGLERVSARGPSNLGAQAFDERGQMTPGAQLKFDALQAFRDGEGLTRRLAEAAEEEGMFEPVELAADLVESCGLPAFYAIRQDIDVAHLVDRAGPEAPLEIATFLAAHRLSLFRMTPLIVAHRRAA